MAKKNEVRVFYSWQSDSPPETNQNAIRKSIQAAIKALKPVMRTIEIIHDEATRNTSGSPNIAANILEKIKQADIVVADVTTVTPPGSARPCPNPNVGFELGYAVSELGWDRAVLMFNKTYGSFPTDLPFDFAQHRAFSYAMGEGAEKEQHVQLADFMKSALEAVIEKNPKRPAEIQGQSREKVEHDSDVKNLKWLMSKIHLPTVDQMINDLPHSFSSKAIYFLDDVSGVVRNSLFHLYDANVEKSVLDLFDAWERALGHDERYHDNPGGRTTFSPMQWTLRSLAPSRLFGMRSNKHGEICGLR